MYFRPLFHSKTVFVFVFIIVIHYNEDTDLMYVKLVHFSVEQIKRREGLIPFPRVGRSGKNNDEKLKDISMAWFGPQMGRDYQRLKSDLEDQYIISLLQGEYFR